MRTYNGYKILVGSRITDYTPIRCATERYRSVAERQCHAGAPRAPIQRATREPGVDCKWLSVQNARAAGRTLVVISGILCGFWRQIDTYTGSIRMLLALILSFSLTAEAITGIVKDSNGGAVSGASVVVRGASGDERQTVTGPDGRFTVDDPPNPGTLIVRAGGFGPQEQPISGPGEVEVVLSPARLL